MSPKPNNRIVSVIITGLLLCGAARCFAAPQQVPLSDGQKVLHVLNRLAFGPRPGDVEAVQKMGLQNWINAQLNPQNIDDSEVEAQITKFTLLQMAPENLLLAYRGDRGNPRRKLQQAQNGKREMSPKQLSRLQTLIGTLDEKKIAPGTSYAAVGELINAKLLRSIESERQLQEVLVDFWANHFNLDAKKGTVSVLLIADERKVIRPHVFGKFRELLEASAKSPAMLEYLDNASSKRNPDQPAMTPPRKRRKPKRKRSGFQKTVFELVESNAGSIMMPVPGAMPDYVKNPAQQGAKGKGGLNENYGRELMELHTLGVNSGYTQEDVINVARCFTGWTYNRKTGAFIFRPSMHDNGAKTVLGHVIAPGGGIQDGEQVLDILAASPATARHLSFKLCQRLVADNPPAALVDRVASVWKQTDGDLKAVVRTIVTSPEFYSPEVYRSKIKSPYEYVVSAVRSQGGSMLFPDNPAQFKAMMQEDGRTSARGFRRGKYTTLARQIALIGQPLFSYQPPTGYTENSTEWVSTGALVARLNFALALANGAIDNVIASPSSLLLDVREENKAEIQQRLIDGILHVPLSDSTKSTLARETSTGLLVDRRKLTALIIGSPEFQRR